MIAALALVGLGYMPWAAGQPAPKVVIIIGDGMDDQQITIARNYLVGYDGRLTLDDMPVRSAVQVQRRSSAVRSPDFALRSKETVVS